MRIVRGLDIQGCAHWAALGADGQARRLIGNLYERPTLTDEVMRFERLLAPVDPVAILGIGLNYRRHAEETRSEVPAHPIVFMKHPASVQHPGAPICLPRTLRSDRVDYECELAVVIGRSARNVTREAALDHVLGYTCANDVSARDWQKNGGGGQWCRGKTFDTFCPLGPTLVTADELQTPNQLQIRTLLNGRVMQHSSTQDMIFDVPSLIVFLSASTTLTPGTVILTGTPEGVGMARNPRVWLQPGDEVSVEIEGIGTLTNPVIEETP
jgi:2-keto-4-pentenoate hydratase/2-oxohepta-3-ene-1,7-dioic acid hydratase in catechol pathway